jgi:hypothetical protein
VAETAVAQALVRANTLVATRLAAVTAAAVTAYWDRLPGYDQPDAERFIRLVSPVVLAAREQASTLAVSYVQAYVNAEAKMSIPVAVTVPPIRAGVSLAEVYHRPFVDVWSGLSKGHLWRDAVHAGRERAEATAQMDVALSHRAGAQAAMANSPRVVGYRRVTHGGSCALCSVAATQTYRSGDLMPIHNRCHCSVEPILGDREPEPVELEGVETVEHGELGPLLIPSGQSFTGPTDI